MFRASFSLRVNYRIFQVQQSSHEEGNRSVWRRVPTLWQEPRLASNPPTLNFNFYKWRQMRMLHARSWLSLDLKLFAVANLHYQLSWVDNTKLFWKLHLCGSVEEHRSAESEALRFDSSWGLRILSWSRPRDKTKNIFFYFSTELKTYHLSFSIYNQMILLHLPTDAAPQFL